MRGLQFLGIILCIPTSEFGKSHPNFTGIIQLVTSPAPPTVRYTHHEKAVAGAFLPV
jgi:hypothetical protein